jgi:hypothetical protein
MSTTPGQKITAAEWNEITDHLNKIFADTATGSQPAFDAQQKNLQSYGWGNSPSSPVAKGDKFSAVVANRVIDKVKLSAQQVGSSYSLNNVQPGQKITALAINQIKTVLDDVDPKRNTAAVDQLSLALLGDVMMQNPWTRNITFLSSLNFITYDRARYYFNSGSSIKLTMSVHGANVAGNAMNSLYEKMGTVNIGLRNTTSSTANIISEDKGFQDLNANDWTKLIKIGSNGGYGYGYGYGYNTPAPAAGGYGYGYGYGGSHGSITVYGKIQNGQVLLKVVVHAVTTSEKTGNHKLSHSLQKAIDKSSNNQNFHINAPLFSGSVS